MAGAQEPVAEPRTVVGATVVALVETKLAVLLEIDTDRAELALAELLEMVLLEWGLVEVTLVKLLDLALAE